MAECLSHRLSAAGLPVQWLRVIAHSVARVWVAEVQFAGSGPFVARYPFAERAGILTPAELASRFATRVTREIRRSTHTGFGMF